jgi:hypothetical protein
MTINQYRKHGTLHWQGWNIVASPYIAGTWGPQNMVVVFVLFLIGLVLLVFAYNWAPNMA